jgi:hypothetical protein
MQNLPTFQDISKNSLNNGDQCKANTANTANNSVSKAVFYFPRVTAKGE